MQGRLNALAQWTPARGPKKHMSLTSVGANANLCTLSTLKYCLARGAHSAITTALGSSCQTTTPLQARQKRERSSPTVNTRSKRPDPKATPPLAARLKAPNQATLPSSPPPRTSTNTINVPQGGILILVNQNSIDFDIMFRTKCGIYLN